ncbi:MAG: glutamate--tRNA ligase [Myxococcaceae bacterium]
MNRPPRVRFAPSPTGYLHIGGARTALFNWLYARRFGGTFVLRIEDTDRERSTPESVKAILDGLEWMSIDWDEGPDVGGPHGPYFQTERLARYRTHADALIAQGHAYTCVCTKEELDERRSVFERQKRPYKYEGTCRNRPDSAGKPGVVRFKMQEGEGSLSFVDKVIGKITKAYADLDDFVMLRADGVPLYNFGCVIDDHEMDITLVVRGQEHINSTFPQLMLYRALGWEPPEMAHLPLILGKDREKLSKRLHPEADVMLHAKNGILPEALLNFIARLGWSHGNEEVISREQMVSWFDFDHVGTTSGVWNPDKLMWLNQHYLKSLPADDIAARLVPFLERKGFTANGDARLAPIVVATRERTKTLVEMADMAAVFFAKGVTLDEKAAAKHLVGNGRNYLAAVREALLPVLDWRPEPLEDVVKKVAESLGTGMGKVAQPVRVAVTGSTISPGIGDTLALIGREQVLERIDAALASR